MTPSLDVAKLSEFSPFDAFGSDNLNHVFGHIECLHADAGDTLFKQGDTDNRRIYLLSGTVELSKDGAKLRQVVGGTDEARFALASTIPRHSDAVAIDAVQYFVIDNEVLDVAVTLDQTGLYKVSDFDAVDEANDDDWMTALLRNNLFQQIPPQCLQMMFMRLQRIDYKAGDVVIQQDSGSDYFYVVRSGRCVVTRETGAGQQNIDLAELKFGDTFGEEAILSDNKRNATVRMLTDGILMRLSRDDFESLLKEQAMFNLDIEQAKIAARHGGQWLDVRVPSEYSVDGIDGAINLPLYVLRHRLQELDRSQPYIVYCDTGRRSSAAAFILNQSGFESAVLEGGLRGIAAA